MLLLLVLALLLAACGPEAAALPSSPQPAGDTHVPAVSLTIRGEVLDEETKQAIPNAVVYVDNRVIGRGTFEAALLLDQQVTVRAEAPGYEPATLDMKPHYDPKRETVLNMPLQLRRLATPTPVRN